MHYKIISLHIKSSISIKIILKFSNICQTHFKVFAIFSQNSINFQFSHVIILKFSNIYQTHFKVFATFSQNSINLQSLKWSNRNDTLKT